MFRSFLPAHRPARLGAPDEDLFAALQRDVNRLFEDFTRGVTTRFAPGRGEVPWVPAVDVKHGANDITIAFDLPGVDEKDVEVSVRDDVVTVRGERRSERTEKGESYELTERTQGRFERAMTLPFRIDEKKVSASYRNGVLTVQITKPPEAKAAETRIPVASSSAPAKAA